MTYFLPFSLSLLLIGGLIPVSHRLGWVDRPGGHKRHRHATPVIGGLGIAVGVLATLAWLEPLVAAWEAYLSASLVLLALGAWDDHMPLPVLPRMVIQALGAYWLASQGGMVVTSLGNYPLVGELTLGPLAVPFTILATVVLMNAINVLDGLDGLLGGVVMAMLGGLGLAAFTGEAEAYGQLALMVLAAVAAFYVYNFRWPGRNRASVFLGDAGSTWLGLTLAWLAIGVSHTEPAALDKVAVLWVLGLPIMDILSTVRLRWTRGKHPMLPGREHIHFVLRDSGLSVNATVAVVTALTGSLGLIGVGLAEWGVSDIWLLGGYVALVLSYAKLMRHLWYGIER